MASRDVARQRRSWFALRRTDAALDGQSAAAPTLPRRRIWVQHVDAELAGMRVRVKVEQAKGLSPEQEEVAQGVLCLIERAQNAADRRDPIPSRITNWWRGTLVESAYRNLHTARAQMVDLYDDAELHAEVPAVVARVHSTLHLTDPRRVGSDDLKRLPIAHRRAWLRRLIEDSYDALDMKYSRLRNFRNVVLTAAMATSALLLVAAWIMWMHPGYIPLCFPAQDVAPGSTRTTLLNCPTQALATSPQQWDVIIVGVLGLLGGALATSIAIRKIQGGSSPYDVPVALAWLKVPLGAFVAVLGIVAIRGGFVPGLSRLDSQEQILAYALLLGFSQQLLTGVLDNKAMSLVQDLPTKESGVETRVVSDTRIGGSTETTTPPATTPATAPGPPG